MSGDSPNGKTAPAYLREADTLPQTRHERPIEADLPSIDNRLDEISSAIVALQALVESRNRVAQRRMAKLERRFASLANKMSRVASTVAISNPERPGRPAAKNGEDGGHRGASWSRQGGLLLRLIGHRPSRRSAGAGLGPAMQRAVEEIRESGYFDPKFYGLKDEAEAAGIDPILHYLKVGEARGFAPSRKFDPLYYAARYPEVSAQKINLFLHFLRHGRYRGFRPLPMEVDDYALGRSILGTSLSPRSS